MLAMETFEEEAQYAVAIGCQTSYENRIPFVALQSSLCRLYSMLLRVDYCGSPNDVKEALLCVGCIHDEAWCSIRDHKSERTLYTVGRQLNMCHRVLTCYSEGYMCVRGGRWRVVLEGGVMVNHCRLTSSHRRLNAWASLSIKPIGVSLDIIPVPRLV
jgi:hypothetical protein